MAVKNRDEARVNPFVHHAILTLSNPNTSAKKLRAILSIAKTLAYHPECNEQGIESAVQIVREVARHKNTPISVLKNVAPIVRIIASHPRACSTKVFHNLTFTLLDVLKKVGKCKEG